MRPRRHLVVVPRLIPGLHPLHAGHADAVLAFERANRAYFATYISDRGDAYFTEFAERFAALLTDQDAGLLAFYVLVGADATILGRFNLTFTGEATAELGYRVAEHAAGRGLATATVRDLCHLAATRHGLRVIDAAVSDANVASQKVLTKSGFTRTGPADPADLGGKPGFWYRRELP